MKKIILMALTAIALVLSLTGCTNDAETFEKYILEGNYTDAIHLYQEKLMDDQADSQACREMVETHLKNSLIRYRQGELPQAEFQTILDTMVKLEDYLYLVDNLEDVYTEYQDVKKSKDDYRKAEALRKEGRLDAAWEAYSEVLPEDTENFSDARKNMDDLMKNMQEDAHSAIQQAQQVFGGAAKDYQAALEILRKAKAAVSEDPELLAQLETMAGTYEAYIPVNLTELNRLKKATYVDVGTTDAGVYTDINGGLHSKDSIICATGAWHNDRAESDEDASVSYNLNYQYSTFTGTIYRPNVFLSYDGDIPAGRCLVKIYGDSVLLYEYSDPGDTGAPWDVIPVNVDVSGVRKLTIVVYGCWNSADSYYDFPEWNPGICLADCILQK